MRLFLDFFISNPFKNIHTADTQPVVEQGSSPEILKRFDDSLTAAAIFDDITPKDMQAVNAVVVVDLRPVLHLLDKCRQRRVELYRAVIDVRLQALNAQILVNILLNRNAVQQHPFRLPAADGLGTQNS